MLQDSDVWFDLVMRRYYEVVAGNASDLKQIPLSCEGCARETLHNVLPDDGICEVYQCAECKRILKVKAR